MKKYINLEQYVEQEIIGFMPKIYNANAYDSNIQEYSYKIYKFKNKYDYTINIWIFRSCIIIELPLKTSLLFSINIPDIVCMINVFLSDIQGVGKVYVNNMGNNSVNDCIDLLNEDLKLLNFGKNEGIIVYKNSLKLVINGNRNLDEVIKILETIKSKIEQFYFDTNTKINKYEMPKEFQRMLKTYAKWAISDDMEKEIKINESDSEELDRLINSIEPKLPEINQYLDSFGDMPLPDNVIELQNLAELVSELIIRI
jgi:hypothetical protein